MFLAESDFCFLQGLKRNPVIPKEKWKLANSLESRGIISLGYDDSGDGLRILGRPTPLSAKLFSFDRIWRSPVRRIIHFLLLPFP